MDAQAEAATNPDNSARDQAFQQVRKELEDVERRWYGLARFRLGYPQTVSVGIGAIIVDQPKDTDCSVSCMVHGWHFEVEPGINGLQGSVGWGKLVGATGHTNRLMHTAHFAWALRGVVLRTWGERHFELKSQSWAGIEGSFSIIGLNLSLGLMRSLSSNATQDWLVTAGLGWGF